MRRLQVATGVLLAMCMMFGSCEADGSVEAGTVIPPIDRALWVLPPAYEFSVSDSGRLSLEIGLTPGLWVVGSHSDDLLGPRVGAFVYPAGQMEGLALYAGLGEIGAELGLWGVWRADPGDGSSHSRRALSFRLGIGAVVVGSAQAFPVGGLGLGASVGFSF